MPTNAGKSVKRTTSGPKGTAAQRATKMKSTSGKTRDAAKMTKKGTALPNRQGM